MSERPSNSPRGACMFERLDDLSFFVHSRDTRPSTSTGPTASHSPSHSLELASSFKAERECIVVRTAGRIRQTAGKESLAARDVSAVCARSSQQWQSPRRKPLGWQSHHPDKRVTKNADLRDETQTHVVRQPGGHASTSKTVHRDVKAAGHLQCEKPGRKHTCLQAATSEGVRLRVDRRGQAGWDVHLTFVVL